MSYPSHTPWFDHPIDILWRVRVIKLLSEQFYDSKLHYNGNKPDILVRKRSQLVKFVPELGSHFKFYLRGLTTLPVAYTT